MSRVGRKPIELDKDVKVALEGQVVKAEAKGKVLTHTIPYGFKLEFSEKEILVVRPSDTREHMSLHGTTRTLIQNMIIGLSKGYEKKLEIQGVGYKAQVKGKVLALDIGKSHTVNFPIPEGITIETTSATEFVVKGVDKQQVGETAATVRSLYPPEPYKGKGIRYVGEYVRRKQGKSIA
jgi:large subunit ribosomal protein L6